MFDRYTDKARRAIFFARYEASQFGSPYIETEHLLLGLLREDKALANRFLRSYAAVESIRRQIEAHNTIREKVSISVDLPLSQECKRALAYAAEEGERLNHDRIGTPHLLLGLLRVEKSFATQLLHERGVTGDWAREEVRQSEAPAGRGGSAAIPGLNQWVSDAKARGGIWIVREERIANRTTCFAIYSGDQPKEKEKGEEADAAEKLEEIRKRLDSIIEKMEHAIANHEFEKARLHAGEERKERENMRQLREQFNLEEPPPRLPFLRVEIIGDDRFSDVQKRCDDYVSQGVTQVWILDPNLKRPYTVDKLEGLREFKGKILRIADPPLEMDLKKIFD